MFDNPWPILTVGAAAEVVLFFVLLRTGRGLLLGIMAGVAVATAALLFVERLVVTPREEVEAALEGARAAVEHNDLAAVLDHLSPKAGEVRQRVKSALPAINVNEVHIGSDLSIELNTAREPASAVATFTARVNAKAARGDGLPYENFVRRFRVGLEKVDGRWQIVTVDDHDLRR